LTVNFKEQPQHKANLRLVQKQQQKKHETLKVCAVALSQQPVWSTEVTAQRRDPESENPELEGIFSCVLAHFFALGSRIAMHGPHYSGKQRGSLVCTGNS
jgi:hypothetical protein